MTKPVTDISKYLEGNKSLILMADVDVAKTILSGGEGFTYEQIKMSEAFEKKFLILEKEDNPELGKPDLRGYIKIIDKDNVNYVKLRSELTSGIITP